MVLGDPVFYMRFNTEDDCIRKSKDYTALVTKKNPNTRTSKCISPDSLELTEIKEIKDKK